jgi:uncharacterized phage-associated protein
MPINKNYEQRANAILYLATNTRYCTKTKLINLLYLLDFEHYRQTGRSVTGESYCALPIGPVPSELYHEMNCPPSVVNPIDNIIKFDTRKESVLVVPVAAYDDDDLTRRQIRILTSISELYCDDSGEVLKSVVCATNGPWSQVYLDGRGHCGYIPYEMALDVL